MPKKLGKIEAVIGYGRYYVPSGLQRGGLLKVDGEVRPIASILGQPGTAGYRIDLFNQPVTAPKGANVPEAQPVSQM